MLLFVDDFRIYAFVVTYLDRTVWVIIDWMILWLCFLCMILMKWSEWFLL